MRNLFLAGIVIFGLFGFAKFSELQKDKWVAPSTAKSIINPVSVKKKNASVKNGAKIFVQFCVACHGTGGKGDGIGGKALTPKPANLTSDLVQNQVDGEIYWKISNGRNAMIKWDPIIPENGRWDLVNYLRTIK